MLSFSKTTGYAIAAMSCLEGPDGLPVRAQDIAKVTNISKSYLSKIIVTLVGKNFIKTKKGYTGGILLTRPPEEITLLEVVVAIEGDEWIGNCLLRIEGCKNSCPTHAFWDEEKIRIENELRSRKLNEITQFKVNTPKRIKNPRKSF